MRPRTRQLMAFAFDPTRGAEYGNHLRLELPNEATQSVTIDWNGNQVRIGPIGRRVAVVDYDSTHDEFLPPIDLESPEFQYGGREPSDMDVGFHQQMVYAVCTATIDTFERAIGRDIMWPTEWTGDEPAVTAEGDAEAAEIRYRRSGESAGYEGRSPIVVEGRLTVYPHAFELANAYCQPERGTLSLGYFTANRESAGPNLPGQVVFTALDYAVIVHELTHMLVHTVVPSYTQARSQSSWAFHEALADVVALLQRFTYRETCEAVIVRSRGAIHLADFAAEMAGDHPDPVIRTAAQESNPLLEIAGQFGHAQGMNDALRSVLRSVDQLDEVPDEIFRRAEVLVAAIIDTLMTVYHRRSADLRRLSGWSPGNDVHPDLAARLATEMAKTSDKLLRLCIRALDYCPPIEIEFGDYLRALVTLDRELAPDTVGFRGALIDAFRARGIFPTSALSFSEHAVTWPSPAIAESCGSADHEVTAFVEVHRYQLGLPDLPFTWHRAVSRHPDQRGRLQTEVVLRVISEQIGDEVAGATVIFDAEGRARFVAAKQMTVPRHDGR